MTIVDYSVELSERFALPNTSSSLAILEELKSILRIHGIDPEDLSFKWDSYRMNTGVDETKLDLKTVRDFKKHLQERLEEDMRGRTTTTGAEKRGMMGTPRPGNDMLDLFIPGTPNTGRRSVLPKRRGGAFETPLPKSAKVHLGSSPMSQRMPLPSQTPSQAFAERKDAGTVVESLNPHIQLPPLEDPPTEARFKLKANTEIAKFGYKTMAMKLSEASEILDDRIEEFTTIIQEHYQLDDNAFGNPAGQSQNEIVAVGRIASDTSEGKLVPSSLVLETSRRMGAGRRVPLRVDKLAHYDLFPGKIVAFRGTNASGEFFQATEMLPVPSLNPVASAIDAIDAVNDRLSTPSGETRALVTLVAAGPYTTDTELDFAAFDALLGETRRIHADALILLGPFVDAEHPLVRTGDFDLPETYALPDADAAATIVDLFRARISQPLALLAQSCPALTIVVCPSVRDAVAKHACWPQDRLPKRELGLPARQCSVVTNPMKLSMNEVQVGMSSLDALDQIRGCGVMAGKFKDMHILERLSRGVLEQRHFFPVFPPVQRKGAVGEDGFEGVGPSLDVSYLKLGEMLGALPDVLISPSILPHFAKVIDGVVVINPGMLSKRRGAGTYARLIQTPLHVTDEERDKGEIITHKLYERCRVDIVKI